MNEDIYSRTKMLVGDDGIDALKAARVLVCGAGGVGGYVIEALARAGVGTIGILDNDRVSVSNLNRQVISLKNVVGAKKTEVASVRVKSINPDCTVRVHDLFYLPETADQVDLSQYDYIVDAIDTVTAKIELICRAKAQGIAIISSMGTGNKLGTDFEVCDIKKTSVCPLAKVLRKELRDRGINDLTVVYSKEQPIKNIDAPEEKGRHIPGSISYVPAAAAMVIAGKVIRDILARQ